MAVSESQPAGAAPQPQTTDHPSPHLPWGEAVEEDLSGYRSVSATAVGGLILGLLSSLAFSHPLYWALPIVGVLVNIMALRRIAHHAPLLFGKRAALLGLSLSLCFGLAAPSRAGIETWYYHTQARQFTMRWFTLLMRREPERALQMTVGKRMRLPTDDSLWARYAGSSYYRRALRMSVEQPAQRALLALGDRAQVRHYQHVSSHEIQGDRRITDIYAVTFRNKGTLKSFFVEVTVSIKFDAESGDRETIISKGDFMHVPPESWPFEMKVRL